LYDAYQAFNRRITNWLQFSGWFTLPLANIQQRTLKTLNENYTSSFSTLAVSRLELEVPNGSLAHPSFSIESGHYPLHPNHSVYLAQLAS
jgi:hypothetical protein